MTGCLGKSIYDKDHGPLGSIHINQLAHSAVHKDESYCIITYTGTCDFILCARTWDTADDGDCKSFFVTFYLSNFAHTFQSLLSTQFMTVLTQQLS
jgi:hypothetical protein